MAFYERLSTRLNPLAERTCFSQVRGADEIVAAVRDCWASLWTAQALAYRHQNGVDHSAVAIGLYPIVTLPYSSTTSYQVSYRIQSLVF